MYSGFKGNVYFDVKAMLCIRDNYPIYSTENSVLITRKVILRKITSIVNCIFHNPFFFVCLVVLFFFLSGNINKKKLKKVSIKIILSHFLSSHHVVFSIGLDPAHPQTEFICKRGYSY